MGVHGYRQVLARRAVRRVLALGLIVRVPMWASAVVLTLHVVSHLHRSYAEAGVLTGVATVALALGAIWRGRRLDRVGLRRTVAPGLVVLAVCWGIAPFVGYLPLLLLASVGELFAVPTFAIVRQSLLTVVPPSQHRTALSMDAVAVELSFMIGPVLGVFLATTVDTSWALFGCQFASILGGVGMWLVDPPLRAAQDDKETTARPRPKWVTPGVVAVVLAAGASTVALTGSDVGTVAALRHLHHQSWIGWVLAVWGLGSAVGGLVYGALRRPVPGFVLLALLAVTTIPVALARDPLTIAALLFVTGLFCAPTITATVHALSELVPERVRGEATGWHSSAMTAGSAAGAPIGGLAVDQVGWQGAFVVTGAVGLAVAVVGLLVTARSHPAAFGAAGEGAEPDDASVGTTVAEGRPAVVVTGA